MLRGRRALVPVANSIFTNRPGAAVAAISALTAGSQHRQVTDKILIGTISALMSCTTTLALFHLIVTPVAGSIAAATMAAAASSGALCVIDGGKEGTGTTFGAVVGVFIGGMGSFYAKSQQEPWRK